MQFCYRNTRAVYMGGAYLSNETKLRIVATHGHCNALVSCDASRRGANSRPTIFRWSVSLKTLVCRGACCRNFFFARQKCVRLTFIYQFPSYFLDNLSTNTFFLHRSVHPHIMLVFEPNWLDGYRVINFFLSPTVYLS